MTENPNDFVTQLSCLSDLYIQSREAITLLENYDPEKKSHLGPHNEIRNALDHVMRLFKNYGNKELCEQEYRATKAHLLRAGYDAYELICVFITKYFQSVLAPYRKEDILKAFQGYTRLRLDVIEVQGNSAKLRAEKEKNGLQAEKTFQFYFEYVEKLIGHMKMLEKHLPSIIELHEEREKDNKIERKRDRNSKARNAVGIIIAILLAAIGIIATIKYSNNT